MITKLIYTRNN